MWGLRCVHESQLHAENSFLTLTYSDAELPENGSLYKPHLQKFFKRLRKLRGPFRYFACGEYGEETKRAHYHVCLFGLDFHDKIHFRRIGENNLYISDELNQIWGHGNTSVGSLTYNSAAYTASYVLKKKFGKGSPGYAALDTDTGELTAIVQPFAVMSLRKAIAREWLDKYHQDIYGHDKDSIYLNGRQYRPTKYYDKIYDSVNPDHMAYLKAQRKNKSEGKTAEQLRAHAIITRARTTQRNQI